MTPPSWVVSRDMVGRIARSGVPSAIGRCCNRGCGPAIIVQKMSVNPNPAEDLTRHSLCWPESDFRVVSEWKHNFHTSGRLEDCAQRLPNNCEAGGSVVVRRGRLRRDV